MIEYVEVRDTDTREVIGIIDTARSIIWHSKFYGVGDFEIYAPATADNLALLQVDRYITRNNNDEVGIVESISITWSALDGLMIAASGRFAKSILDRRVIYNLDGNDNKATRLSGNLEQAIRGLVDSNAINSTTERRNIAELVLGALGGYDEIIMTINDVGEYVDGEIQVGCENLLEFSDKLLEDYKMSSMCRLNADNNLEYIVRKGADRTTSNTDGNEPIVFSQEFDNIAESAYSLDGTAKKTFAVIGGEEENGKRFYSQVSKAPEQGRNRREAFIDASSIKKKYKDETGEHTYTTAEYINVLTTKGSQDISAMAMVENFTGKIIVDGSQYTVNVDFGIGDDVTVQDNNIGKYIDTKIVEMTEVQDENGYTIDVVYK